MSPGAHILFVDDYRDEHIGGGELHLLRIARGCREAGYRVGVVCVPGSGLESRARLEGHDVWPVHAGRDALRDRWLLRRLFTALSPDIVHVHGFYASLVACGPARRAGVPVVLATVHSMPSAPLDLYPGVRGRLEYRLRAGGFRRIAAAVDRFVCVVCAARDELLEIGIDDLRLAVIPNGIPDPAIEAGGASRAEAGARLCVGSVGRLEPPKGYEYFVEAAAIVARERADVTFRLVGDGGLRTSLETRVANLGLSGRFEFAGWSDEALVEMAGMDVYVVSSVTDTTNLTVLEAMGLGLPVVATAVGGIPEEIADGVSGYVVPPRRPDLLASRIADLLRDEALRTRMGAEGRRRFEEPYTEECMVSAHLNLYEQLLGR